MLISWMLGNSIFINQRGNSLASVHLVKQDQHFCEIILPWHLLLHTVQNGAACYLCTWPCLKRVTRWIIYRSVFLFKGYIDWPFLWRWLVRMGRAGPGHRKTGSVSWCAWACCLLTTQLSIRLEQLVLLLSVVLVLPHRSVTRTVICSYPSCLLAVLFQPF